MELENILSKLKEIIGSNSQNISILEEQIDIETQMEYFEYSRKIKGNFNLENVLAEAELIFLDTTDLEHKKELLTQLASIEEVTAFRFIEKYNSAPDEDLKKWAILALQESRILIENMLLDEKQIFISTGLGGKNNKLRYFVVIIGNSDLEFTDFQKDLIIKEFNFSLEKYGTDLEEVVFDKNFAALTVLVAINSSIKKIFKECIEECNNCGNFLSSNFIVTNVKKLSNQEIKNFIQETESRNKKDTTDL